jgi:hypothetical protein
LVDFGRIESRKERIYWKKIEKEGEKSDKDKPFRFLQNKRSQKVRLLFNRALNKNFQIQKYSNILQTTTRPPPSQL